MGRESSIKHFYTKNMYPGQILNYAIVSIDHPQIYNYLNISIADNNLIGLTEDCF